MGLKQEDVQRTLKAEKDQCDWSSVNMEELGLECIGIDTKETGMLKSCFDLIIPSL
jgi:hypothetical protein